MSYGLVGSDSFNGSAPHFLYQNDIVMGSGYGYWTGLPTNEITRTGPSFRILSIQDAGDVYKRQRYNRSKRKISLNTIAV